MKKEYVTGRLFKNHRAADVQITEEELQDCNQQQLTKAPNNTEETNETLESCSDQNESSLQQRFLSLIRRALEPLRLDH